MDLFKKQILPIFLTFTTFLILITILFFLLFFLNKFTVQDIVLKLNPVDIFVGLVIYLKTSFDFAIFIVNLMESNLGWQKRIAIEAGTSVGNAGGTILILIIWIFFKQVPILLALMIFIASLVLIQMAQEGLEKFIENSSSSFTKFAQKIINLIRPINRLSSPLLSKVIPSSKVSNVKPIKFLTLIMFSITVPFILGLDDFAGYIPVFSLVNVFGFCSGIFLGHALLNTALFLSPSKTTKISKSPLILIIGSLAFIFIAIYGLVEIFRIFF